MPERTTSIVMLSSVAGGPTAIKSGSVYAMTKAAMDQVTKNLACEWASDGIRVNSVKVTNGINRIVPGAADLLWVALNIRGAPLQPWYVATPLAAPVLEDKELLASVEGRTPMRRVGQPEEISGGPFVFSLRYKKGLTVCYPSPKWDARMCGTSSIAARRNDQQGQVEEPPFYSTNDRPVWLRHRPGGVSVQQGRQLDDWAKHCCGRRVFSHGVSPFGFQCQTHIVSGG